MRFTIPSASLRVPAARGSGGGALGAGFTLVELLIVIAIVAILASMLFPVFGRARAKARSVGCVSNEKQLAQALAMYASDYDNNMVLNYYPYVLGPPQPGNFCDHSHWPFAIYAYHRNTNIFICPERPEWQSGNSCETGGYAVNAFVVRRFAPPLNEAAVDDPGGTVLLVDSYAHPVDVDDWNGPDFSGPGGQLITNVMQTCNNLPLFNGGGGRNCVALQCCAALLRHTGGMNVAYCDGHVKWTNPHHLQQRAFTPAAD